ncbi:MAG TPA: NAD(P)-dependent oxidoreductase [Bauldia sp.]|nr:NAD(P)-dependent oxidoreductase [Bauldia sp.]
MSEKIEIALIGVQTPIVLGRLEDKYILHPVFSAPDPLAALAKVGGRVRAALGHGMAGLTRAQMDLMPKLEICALHGVGLETTDLAEARRRGITVTIAPVLYDDVADIALALALAAFRRVSEGDRYIRAGKWLEARLGVGRKFTGARAGIIGLGRIGIEIARRLEGFRMPIAYADPVRRDVPYRHYADAVALARDSDVLFLAAAGAPRGAGKPIVGRDVIEALGPRGIFVNVARGWLVDELALVDALVNRRIAAAGLDVFDDEPRVPAALMKLDNVVMTPHVASWSEETLSAMGNCVADNIDSWFAGKGALTPA